RCRTFCLAVPYMFEQLQERRPSKTIARGWPSFSTFADREPIALQRDRIKKVHSSRVHFGGAARSDVHVHLVWMIHLRRVHASGLKMNAEPGENSGDFLSGPRHDPDGLRKMQRVKYGVRSTLRQALHA